MLNLKDLCLILLILINAADSKIYVLDMPNAEVPYLDYEEYDPIDEIYDEDYELRNPGSESTDSKTMHTILDNILHKYLDIPQAKVSYFDYEEYDPIDEVYDGDFELRNSGSESTDLKTMHTILESILHKLTKRDQHTNRHSMCQRMFKSMNGAKSMKKCLKILKNEKRFLGHDYLEKIKKKVEKREKIKFTDRTNFAQDYFDIRNLRSKFSDDYYFDINAMGRRSDMPFKISRKRIAGKRRPGSDSSSESVSLEEKNNLHLRKKPKRFQVISEPKPYKVFNEESSDKSQETDDDDDKIFQVISGNKHKPKQHKVVNKKSSDESQESDDDNDDDKSGDDDDKNVIDNNSSITSDVQESDGDASQSIQSSTEVTTPKPHSKGKKYVYLQGNNIFDVNGRRRLEHFMPKRFHWDENDLQHLGYYWFNGPKGRYPDAFRHS